MWKKEMGTLDSVNTLQMEVLYKSMKEAYQNSNKVDYVAQMCFWDDQQLSVETQEAKLWHLAVEEVGNWSQKIEETNKTHTLTYSALPSLRGLQYRHSQCPLQQVEKDMEVISLDTAMISYIR
jgi:hypothetical protein